MTIVGEHALALLRHAADDAGIEGDAKNLHLVASPAGDGGELQVASLGIVERQAGGFTIEELAAFHEDGSQELCLIVHAFHDAADPVNAIAKQRGFDLRRIGRNELADICHERSCSIQRNRGAPVDIRAVLTSKGGNRGGGGPALGGVPGMGGASSRLPQADATAGRLHTLYSLPQARSEDTNGNSAFAKNLGNPLEQGPNAGSWMRLKDRTHSPGKRRPKEILARRAKKLISCPMKNNVKPSEFACCWRGLGIVLNEALSNEAPQPPDRPFFPRFLAL